MLGAFPPFAQPDDRGASCSAGDALPVRFQYVNRFEDDSDADFLSYWRMLARHKGALLIGAFVGTLTGLLIALPQTPLYQAKVSLEIQGLNENFLNMKDFSPTSTGGGYYPEFDIQTQVKILESRSLFKRV